MNHLIVLQHVFNIIAVLFILWMCVRWNTSDFPNSALKTLLLLLGLAGILLELKSFGVL